MSNMPRYQIADLDERKLGQLYGELEWLRAYVNRVEGHVREHVAAMLEREPGIGMYAPDGQPLIAKGTAIALALCVQPTRSEADGDDDNATDAGVESAASDGRNLRAGAA